MNSGSQVYFWRIYSQRTVSNGRRNDEAISRRSLLRSSFPGHEVGCLSLGEPNTKNVDAACCQVEVIRRPFVHFQFLMHS
jgi:hypothetical protein